MSLKHQELKNRIAKLAVTEHFRPGYVGLVAMDQCSEAGLEKVLEILLGDVGEQDPTKIFKPRLVSVTEHRKPNTENS